MVGKFNSLNSLEQGSELIPIFGVAADSTWDTDQLLVNSYIGCYVARNLSRDGVPY